ncbi:MAG: NADH-quinone oxidoreductase subunit C [Planctomycetaceae bacterium]|nr:NADH-quinone oxidoreductase subunit C [Planctomycetaceae bacterium]
MKLFDISQLHQLLLDRFDDSRITAVVSEAVDPWVEVAPAAIHEVCLFLRDEAGLRFDHLNDLTAIDWFEPDPKKAKSFGHEPHLEVVYHLSSYEHLHSTVIKVRLPRWKDDIAGQPPEIPTVSTVWGIADWHEREAWDLMGIHFVGHANLRRILCPEDWVGHPLRKDYEFPLEYHGIRGG